MHFCIPNFMTNLLNISFFSRSSCFLRRHEGVLWTLGSRGVGSCLSWNLEARSWLALAVVSFLLETAWFFTGWVLSLISKGFCTLP